MVCDMLEGLMNNANIWSEAQRTNVRGVVPQATTIVLIALCLAVVSLSVIGCETEKTGYEKTIAIWEECMMSESEITDARGIEIMRKYESLFERQPNYESSAFGFLTNEDTGELDWDRVGIEVLVTKKVDQSTLPEADRIPDCLEGVPVQILEGNLETETP